MKVFSKEQLNSLFLPDNNSYGEDNGQITIIGGSSLFHGAPLLSLKIASRVVDMVFFASPDKSVGEVAEKIKSELLSFIWVPWEDVEDYIVKSDAVLIGPGFMRFSSEKVHHSVRHVDCDDACQATRNITEILLKKYPEKRWVIDAGSLQTMEAEWIPENAILTPNRNEFELLFKLKKSTLKLVGSKEEVAEFVQSKAKKHKCIIVLKGPETIVCSPTKCILVKGGNAGMTKGGTGDTLAGLTVALAAKNDPFVAASAASYITKAAADVIFNKKGVYYNADDLVVQIPLTFKKLMT